MATGNSVFLANQSAATQGGSIVTSALETPIVWLRYLGTAASGATVTVNAGGDLLFTTDGTTADTSVNTTGTIDMSTPGASADTFGEVAGLINASTNWQCYLLAVLPEDGTDNVFAAMTEIDLSTAAKKSTGHYLFADESVSYDTGWAISGFDPTKSLTDYWNDDNCVNYLTYAKMTCDASGATGSFKVYSANQTSSTLIKSVGLADNTATTFGNAGVNAPFAQSKFGERLVVLVRNDQTGATDSLECSGHSVDWTGARYNNGYSVTNVNA